MEFSTDIFSLFDKKWALLSAGTKDDHNTMTISWGGMGTLWNKPVVTVYVKPIRFTHKFMNENEYFTVSFLPEEKRGYPKSKEKKEDAAESGTAKKTGKKTAAKAEETKKTTKKTGETKKAAAKTAGKTAAKTTGKKTGTKAAAKKTKAAE